MKILAIKIVSYMIIFSALAFLLVSCVNAKQEASKKWADSVGYFDSGDVDKAFKVARDMAPYDLGGSDYLTGQYMIYGAAKNGLNFLLGMDATYNNMLRLKYDGVSSTYLGHYVAAQIFSEKFLHGNDSAAKLLVTKCKVLFDLDPEHCGMRLLRETSAIYLASYGHLDAICLYESARIGHDLKLIDPSISNFYMALALVKIDNERANFSIKDMELHGALNSSMRGVYCAFIKGVNVSKVAIDCNIKMGGS